MRLSLLARAASTAAWEDSSSSSETTMPGSTTRSETNRTGSRVSDTGVSLSETLSDTDSTSDGPDLFRCSSRAKSGQRGPQRRPHDVPLPRDVDLEHRVVQPRLGDRAVGARVPEPDAGADGC